MNSPLSSVDFWMTKNEILSKILKEFEFFDEEYFSHNKEAIIRIYLTGHGETDYMVTNWGSNLPYKDLLKSIINSA